MFPPGLNLHCGWRGKAGARRAHSDSTAAAGWGGQWPLVRERAVWRGLPFRSCDIQLRSAASPGGPPQEGPWMNKSQPLSPHSLQSPVHWPNSTRSQRTKKSAHALHPSQPPRAENRMEMGEPWPWSRGGKTCCTTPVCYLVSRRNVSESERMHLCLVSVFFSPSILYQKLYIKKKNLFITALGGRYWYHRWESPGSEW